MATGWATTSGSSNDAVWSSWSSATSGTSTNDTVWVMWADAAGTTSNVTTNGSSDVWVTWTAVASTPAGNTPAIYGETEERRQARQERQRQCQESLEAIRLKKEEARKKAEELLRETLDAKQREQFDSTKWFFVISQSGKRYRIRHGWVGNIEEIDQEDMIVASYCIHPQTRVPIEDSMLIQKLMLEADEERFVQIANKQTFITPQPLAV